MALSKVASPLVFGATLLGLIPYAAQTAPADVILVAGAAALDFIVDLMAIVFQMVL